MRVIAVMSGKGGVGKSFVATGLVMGLRRRTGRVAAFDADITGASMPHMLGVTGGALIESDRFVPALSHDGVRVLSMGLFLADQGKAIIWRGPLISQMIGRFYAETDWGDTEYLVIDMPPGTSDAALTVLERVRPDAVLIVTTPQDMVANIARRSEELARREDGDVIGLVMNMAYVPCPHCGEQIEMFGLSREADSEQPTVVATFPLVPEWAALSDSGRIAEAAVEEFDALADVVLAHLGSKEPVSRESS